MDVRSQRRCPLGLQCHASRFSSNLHAVRWLSFSNYRSSNVAANAQARISGYIVGYSSCYLRFLQKITSRLRIKFRVIPYTRPVSHRAFLFMLTIKWRKKISRRTTSIAYSKQMASAHPWPCVRPGLICWLVALRRETSSEDTLLFCFTLKSGSVLSRRPSPPHRAEPFLSVFLWG